MQLVSKVLPFSLLFEELVSTTDDSSSTLAHGDAYVKGVIHRDVSAGNVLIHIIEEVVSGQLVQIRVGLLTDWELSKRTDAPATPRQPDRTVSDSATRSLSRTDACSIGLGHLAIHVYRTTSRPEQAA